MKKTISQTDKEDLAFALILLKDFKCQGKFDIGVAISVFELADFLGVHDEYEKLTSKIPPMKIEPRY